MRPTRDRGCIRMRFKRLIGIAVISIAVVISCFGVRSLSQELTAEQPIAIFHAHDEPYAQVATYVCELAKQGYSHVQIAPAQQSNPGPFASPLEWAVRYQPVDYRVIAGRGNETELQQLTTTATRCNIKVIADVVFNHMANLEQFKNLNFPAFTPQDFHSKCDINYNDGNTITEKLCWLNGDLPDLNQRRLNVREIHQAHLQKLVDLGISGFRFDAAKHIEPQFVQEYISYINRITQGRAWNYLEVIEDSDTRPEEYTPIAAITDFRLCNSLLQAFQFGGDLRSLRVPTAINDPRSITFGINHDTDPEINPGFPVCRYRDRTDGMLANAYVLARESGTPLILGKDNLRVPYINHGVNFRRMMQQRGKAGRNVKETILAVVDSPTLLLLERGTEGFFVVNKAAEKFNIPVLDLTLTNLEGCYRELRNNFTVAVERRNDGRKYVTRWGTTSRGGIEVQGRDALFLIRVPFSQCAG
jgi:alpha-amylase